MTYNGMIVDTSSITGYTALSVVTRARPPRPRSLSFAREQAAIKEWIATALSTASIDADFAREIVECRFLLEGYGATCEHGWETFA
ncbi:DUF6537 domain-containing protein [Nocardia abscessus]|uniref:DUF6537 domain-containing protein n=1 Tax=Nocardia abscessus TaxID=120957 RepID=UPI002453E173|nr:DUF6537 domain-containing protein [Nocardia abscessus]